MDGVTFGSYLFLPFEGRFDGRQVDLMLSHPKRISFAKMKTPEQYHPVTMVTVCVLYAEYS